MLKINGVKLLVFTLVDYDAKFLLEYYKSQHQDNLQSFEKLLRANGKSEKRDCKLLNISARTKTGNKWIIDHERNYSGAMHLVMRRNQLAQISWNRYRFTYYIYLCNLFIAFNALISLFCIFCFSRLLFGFFFLFYYILIFNL